MIAKLPDLCSIQYGFAFDSANFTEDDRCPPLVRIRDVKRGFSETFYSGAFSDQYLVHAGDLLIGMDGEFNIARWKSRDALLNQRVCKVTAKPGVCEEYLRFALIGVLKEIEARTSFVTVKHLSAKELNQLTLSIPSYEAQARIAALLNKIENILALRAKELSALDSLVKSRFVEMFSNNAAWVETTVAAVCQHTRTGPFGSALHHDEFVESGIFVLGIDNAVENRFTYNRMRYITPEKYEQLKCYTVHPGDVIITIMGTIGRSAVIPPDMPTAINTKHLACLTPNREKVDSTFLCHAFQTHPGIRAQLAQQTKGAIMAGLNLTIINGLKFKLPPLALQKQFSAFVARVNNAETTIQRALSETQRLFDSLLQEHFG